MDIAKALRQHQEEDLETGYFWKPIHEFTLRTLIQFFRDDMDEMGYPCFCIEKLPGERRAQFATQNGFRMTNIISLDLWKIQSGFEMVELIAHELVHMWEHMLEYPQKDNKHTTAFHEKMADYGIVTQGNTGDHVGLMGGVWEGWLETNEDLNLGLLTTLFGATVETDNQSDITRAALALRSHRE